MNFKVNKYFLLTLFIGFSTVQAQLPRKMIEFSQKVTSFDKDYFGSIYKQKEPSPSKVFHTTFGNHEVNLQYNVYIDAIEYELDNQTYTLLKTDPANVQIGDEFYYYGNFKTQRKQKREGYYVLIDNQEYYRIFKKYTLDIKESKPNDQIGSSSENTKGKIKLVTTYYLEENNIVIELPTKKKDMLAMFESRESELKDFFKKEKLKLKNEEDLIKFVSHFNVLNQNEAGGKGMLSSLAFD